MKSITFVFGFIAAFSISTGIMFKVMHWPGATVLLFAGFCALILTSVMLVATATEGIKQGSGTSSARVTIGFIASLLISSGSIFKIQHWPGASIQIVVGMVLLNVVFLPMFFYHLYKQAIGNTTGLAR